MRLSETERSIIRCSVSETFGSGTCVNLFGSRIDASSRGGDIDLYVETDLPFQASFKARTRLALLLDERLGEQKIDILVRHAGMKGDPSPIYRVARETGVRL